MIAAIRAGLGALDASPAMRRKASAQLAGRSRPSLADIGPVEALRLEAIPHEAGLVGNPFLVHVLMGAGQDAHDFAAAGIDADVGADGIHDIDRFGLAQLPGPAANS